ncbi:MAG: hypothetical protein ABI609_18320 [Acidobacteriota bacterium]
MSDQILEKELKRLLSDVDLAREQEQLSKRQRSIAERTLLARYGQLLEKPILPAMRMLMFELEKRGHLGKLERKNDRKLRLEVQVAGKKAVHATIEAELLLSGEPRLRLSVHHEFRVLHSVEAPLEGLDDAVLAPLLIGSLERVTKLIT